MSSSKISDINGPDLPEFDDLNMLTDTLGELLERAEALFSRRFQVATYIKVDERHRFGFKRTNKAWRLVWVTDDGTPVPVPSISRGWRVQAAKAIPKLHEALIGERMAMAVELNEVIHDLEAYLDELEAEGDDS